MNTKNRTKESFNVEKQKDRLKMGPTLTYSKNKSKKNPDYRIVEQRDLVESYDEYTRAGFVAHFESVCEGLDNVTVEGVVEFGYGGDDFRKTCVVGDREPTERELELVKENELFLAQKEEDSARTKAEREAEQFEALRKSRPDLFEGLSKS